MSIENHETYAEITAELRSLSKSEELSIGAQYNKDYPTVCGKPICVYFADLADRLDAWAKRDGVLRVPVDVWNDMARKVESADALRGAIDRLPDITETDARSIEYIAKYAMDHSMYGGGIIQAMTGSVREAKRVLAEQRGAANGRAK